MENSDHDLRQTDDLAPMPVEPPSVEVPPIVEANGHDAVVPESFIESVKIVEKPAAEVDSAGKPLHGGLRERSIHRGSEYSFFARQLRPRGHNLRMWASPRNRAKVIEFAQTAKDGGIRVPISVYHEENEILIEHGETRWLAVMLLEGEDIRGVLDGVTDPKILDLLGCLDKDSIKIKATSAPRVNEIDRLRDTVVHNSGNQFADLELARGIKQFIDWGKTQVEIADILGGEAGKWTQTRVSHLNQLNYASPKLQQWLMEERINTTTVVNAMREHGKDAEAFVRAAMEDGQEVASKMAENAMAKAVAAQQEVERIKAMGDNSMVEPAPGKRPIPALEAAQRRATAAAGKAEAAKQAVANGPRVSGKDITTAVLKRQPNANVRPSLSKALVDSFIDAVRYEAQYSPSELTRERMNDVLKRGGYPVMAARVDNEGNELQPEVEAEAVAAE